MDLGSFAQARDSLRRQGAAMNVAHSVVVFSAFSSGSRAGVGIAADGGQNRRGVVERSRQWPAIVAKLEIDAGERESDGRNGAGARLKGEPGTATGKVLNAGPNGASRLRSCTGRH